LNHAAEEVARENFSVRVPENSKDELGILARTFNHMSASIQSARDEQVRSGQIMAVGRLAAAIAHDLRNPLSAVVGGTEMLAEFDLSADQIKSTASHAHKAARRMEKMLEEIGQVARDRAGQRQACLIRDLVASAVESQEERAAEQRVSIIRGVESDLRVECERSRIERVLVNLISNALDVLPSGGEISVRAWSSDRMARIEISDNGPGVPAEIRGRLFQPFVTAGKKDGLGLGLALARQTLLDHGGDLVLEPSDVGARFCLSLPLL
jgi:signal transduction histidine kinase